MYNESYHASLPREKHMEGRNFTITARQGDVITIADHEVGRRSIGRFREAARSTWRW